MKNKFLLHKLKRRSSFPYSCSGRILILMLLVPLLFPLSASAQYTSQSQLFREGIYYFNSTGGENSNGCSNGNISLLGSDREQEIWNYFIGKGLSPVWAAAIVGNLEQESGFDPEESQSGGNSQIPSTAVNVGWGIAQWTTSAGDQGVNPVTSAAQTYHITTPIYTLSTQLNIMWAEMTGSSPTGYTDLVSGLNQQASIFQATQFFEGAFEEGFPAALSGGGQLNNRVKYAESAYNEYSGSTTTVLSSGCGTSTTTTTTTASVNCNNTSGVQSSLSPTRQKIVCIAEQQLALWESKKGYPYPAYAASGFLDYSLGVYEQWCADFASWVYNQAGVPFSNGNDGWDLAGVPDIVNQGQTNPNFSWHPSGSGYIPQPGDLAIYNENGQTDAHVNIFISYSDGVATYIGGDQGNPPDGVYGGNVTTTPPNPPSESNVSTQIFSGYWGDGSIIGYVSPN